MPGTFDKDKLEIECPSCGSKCSIAIRELKRPNAKCPNCGAKLDTAQFRREIKKIENDIDGLGDITIDI